ncbi:PREDICTED: DNA-directed primase/polymerase [Prunus dulcis]|uniref:DNA-directed primase/polymerase protein n=1 Tax=Prunus dulcis TaxID=3755 RepID=A0A5E4E5Y9_PRUDU|nr:DNA-directed primase/polymerase protein isoform X4 [Prunus dulcis]VVA11184.1 PREDICTED: DNA-directed primase/polymerase [Prunus dulcis]
MDDVDRLFECFKCGVSPPQSALRERKRSKSNLKRRSKTQEVSSPGSAAEQTQKYASEIQLSAEKSGSGTVKANNFNRAKQFSPVVFYGSPNGVPPKKPSRSLLRLLREIRVDLATQKRLSSRKEVWATFPRQDEAMQFAKGNGNVHVFSYQDHYSGQRRFLVSTYDNFWRRYNNMNPKFRHHYEVIQEGLPCHLYFDLEFNKRDNAGRNGDEMVDVLISVIFEALLEKYSIQGNQEWILELDSSTEAKFSRHLIIRIEKTAFKDNSHVGAFVTEICSRISSAKERDGRFGNFFVRKDSKSSNFASQLFVDTAVYTRNRCFRLALSSKAGKNSVLLPTGRFKAMDMQSEEEMFMASLICNLDVDCEKLLVCKTDLDCIKTLHFDTEVNRNFGKCYSWPQEFALNGGTTDASATYFLGKSPFPALDAFIESVATVGNVSGKIRSWYWFSEFGHMVYSMSRNRYCERIGRQHKSNHVIYVADLRRAAYYQKCHDPDCRGYRSPSRPIPLDIIPEMVHEYRNDHECVPYGDQNMTSSCITDSWWLEAIRVADDVENKKIDISNMENIDLEDDNWWMAVEKTASQAELAHFN